MRGHFDYAFFDFPPFGRHFGDRFEFGHCARRCGPFRGYVEPFNHHDRPGCIPFGPPRPHKGHHNADHQGPFGYQHSPPHERHHGFQPDCHGPRHHNGPYRRPDCDFSPDRHERRPIHTCGPPRGSPDHSPGRHHGPHHMPGPRGRPDHSPMRQFGSHHRPRPCGQLDHSPDRHGPSRSLGGPRCSRRRSPKGGPWRNFGCKCHRPDFHSHRFGPYHGPDGFEARKACGGPRRPGHCGRPEGSRRRGDWDCENGPCCSSEDQAEGCDRREENEPCSVKDKDNETGDTILVQRIVVEKAPRPNSI